MRAISSPDVKITGLPMPIMEIATPEVSAAVG